MTPTETAQMPLRALAPGDVRALAPEWRRAMRAENLAATTIQGHLVSLGGFSDFLVANGMPTEVASLSREHVEHYLVHILETWSAANAAKKHQGLNRFFRWALEEGETTSNPMERIRAPRQPEPTVRVVPEADLKAILAACAGKDFRSVRDHALLRLMIDCGLRLNETCGLRVTDIDRDAQLATVLGKGSRVRTVSYGRTTSRALDRYFRARARHRSSYLDNLWLGLRGPLQDSGVTQALAYRCELAGVERVNPHRLRHSFAHAWLASGGHESDLMTLAGWRSRSMLSYYGRSAASERAQAANRRNSLADRL